MRKNIINIILGLILTAGLGLIAYPTVSDWYNSYHQSYDVMNYADTVAKMEKEQLDRIWEGAERYNEEEFDYGNSWKPTDSMLTRYLKELNIDDTGMMGYVVIPKIDVKLPLYHTTEENVLQRGIGHLSGTSLPVGGEGTHCVVSGHRGLPTSRLLTDLDKLVVGDKFQLNILDRTLSYEVDQIRIVEPGDFSQLEIVPEMDYVTLFTCTPYGINSHRLLVRGHRIKTANGSVDVPSDAMQYEPVLIAPFFAAPVLFLGLVWLLLTTSSRRRLRHSREKALSEVMDGTGTVVSGEGRARQTKKNGESRNRRPKKSSEGQDRRAKKIGENRSRQARKAGESRENPKGRIRKDRDRRDSNRKN